MVRTQRGSTSASDPEPHIELPAITRKGRHARQTTQVQPAPVVNGVPNGGAAAATPAVGAGVAVGEDVAAALRGGAAVVVGGVEAVAIGAQCLTISTFSKKINVPKCDFYVFCWQCG